MPDLVAGVGRTMWGLCCCLVFFGCGSHRFPYATPDDDSINGVSIFIGMLEDRGYDVTFKPFLPEGSDADLLICFDRHGSGLNQDNFEALMDFSLQGESPRLAIYFSPAYLNDRQFWADQARAFPANALEVDTEALLEQQAGFVGGDLPMYPGTRGDSFSSGWAELRNEEGGETGIQIPQGQSWSFDHSYQVLYLADDAPHIVHLPNAYQEEAMEGVTLVTHPYLFMNYALVGERHRRVVEGLLDLFPAGRATIIDFPGTLAGSKDRARSIFSFLSVFPLNWVVWHFLLVLVLFFICKWPIVGYPEERSAGERGSFTEHISAYGRLLQLTGDFRFAYQQIRQFLKSEKRERNVEQGGLQGSEPGSLDDAIAELNREME